MADAAAIGIDVGGTKCLAAAVDPDGRVIERRRIPSPGGDADALVPALVGLVEDLGADLAVGVGVAGLVDDRGVVRYGPNIAVRGLPLLGLLEEELQGAVTVANDATVAAVGEARVGAARGASEVVMITLGTGVGGGMIVGGRAVLGHSGLAGELGHITVEAEGRPCPCGRRGCVEAYASGTAIGLRAREVVAGSDRETLLRGHDQATLDGKAVSRAAAAGDALAISLLEEAGRWLGVALGSLVNTLDPAVVVIGGGAGPETGPWLIPAARASMGSRVMGSDYRELPPVVPAAMGDDAGVVGAALLALDRVA